MCEKYVNSAENITTIAAKNAAKVSLHSNLVVAKTPRTVPIAIITATIREIKISVDIRSTDSHLV